MWTLGQLLPCTAKQLLTYSTRQLLMWITRQFLMCTTRQLLACTNKQLTTCRWIWVFHPCQRRIDIWSTTLGSESLFSGGENTIIFPIFVKINHDSHCCESNQICVSQRQALSPLIFPFPAFCLRQSLFNKHCLPRKLILLQLVN